MTPLPRWVDIGLLPLINLALALAVAGLVVALVGENPVAAMVVMVEGAFVYPGSLGYTLYYTTNFIFTGLAVSVAFHAALFNIGGEGQATLGGLGVALGGAGGRAGAAGAADRPARDRRARRSSARPGPSSPAGCRPIAAATSSSRRSCSTSSPPG